MGLLARLDPAVEKHWLLLLAGALWTAFGVMLGAFAVGWLEAVEPGVATPLAVAGLVAALLIYRFGFSRLAVRNIVRIASAVPDRVCVELKSLKLYIQAFRNQGIFYEDVVNVILDDLVRAVHPRRMTVEGRFNVRGGISSVVTASYEAPVRGRRRKR